MERLLVIKIGGHVIDNEAALSEFLKDFASITEPKILVHGGGKLATRMAEKLDIPQQIIDGRRITDAETLRIITMVYGGYVNKTIVALLQSIGCNAFGLSGVDGNLILAHKRNYHKIDYGFVGDIDSVNTTLLKQLLQIELWPVFAPITHDRKGQLLNTNADTIASSIAVALAEFYSVRLIYCFEKRGVLNNLSDEHSVIEEINTDIYRQLKNDQKIVDGILPKIDNAFNAIHQGVKEVIIGAATDLMQNVSAKPAGTLIQK